MNSCRGGMYPAQLSCSGDLVTPQRPRNREIGINDFFADAIVVGKLYDFELREIGPQPLRKPLRCDPGMKAVIERNKKFHFASSATTTRRSCPVISLGCGTPRMPNIVGAMSCSAPSGLSVKRL